MKLLFLWMPFVGCDDAQPVPQVVAPPTPTAETLLLARHPEWVEDISIASRNRTGDVPDGFPPISGWLPGTLGDDMVEYTAENPTLSRLSPALPEGFAVVDSTGRPLRFVRDGSGGVGSWAVSGDHIRMFLAPGSSPAGYRIRYPEATQRLRRFNFADDGRTEEEFVFRTERIKSARHFGVYLPAPAQITWTVTVPRDGRLVADAALMRSPIKAEQVSDGVTVLVEVEDASGAQVVATLPVGAGQWKDLEADLRPWAGRQIQLRIRVDAGETNLEDYLIIGEPTLYTPKEDPRRIVVFFVDTLRADHMGLYGHVRDTTPNIDRWAEGAAVFEEVRSVAPWTYPAARSILSGRMPDQWSAGPVLPELMAAAGWSTIAFTNNAYLSRFFGMDRGWSWHFYTPELDARAQTRTLVDALGKNTDRDTLLLVQLMDVHLPYAEPEPYRSLFTDQQLPSLPDPIRRQDVLEYDGDQTVLKGYLVDRYDQSLRYLDRAIAPIFERLNDNDTLIILSDHGEEFWEHGGFEHGHSLYEELLRVPLIIDSPAVAAGRVDAPASLLDVTPTILDIAGLPAMASAQGMSLLGATHQQPDALAALQSRPQGFGFVLYDEGGWGAWSDGQKWVSQGGVPEVFDLRTDPGEQEPTALSTPADNEPWRAVVAQALGRPAGEAWRLWMAEEMPRRPQRIVLSAPGGIEAAWASLESPNVPAPDVRIEQGEAIVSAVGGGRLPRELFVQTTQGGAPLTIHIGDQSQSFAHAGDGFGVVLGAFEGVEVGLTMTAQPAEALQTTASSVESQLRALGYVE